MLHAICGSLVVGTKKISLYILYIFLYLIGPKGEPVNIKLFPQANGDYMGEFTPKQVGKYKKST
jgi:hypothetical protein